MTNKTPIPSMTQTEGMLADGGMMEEGGTVDPVSGNDVPTGSLKEEVRDDVDAKLSPGEFVIPADVVRYIGLEKLMKIRDAAKEGLKRMEEVGQMGNAEEAPKADEAFEENDEEFEGSIDEIMSEVDDEEKTTNMAAGGFITGAYTEGMTSNPAVDVRYFKHPDGRVIYITHINGKPMTAIPEGFTQTDKPVEQKVGKVAEEKAAAVTGGAGAGGGGSDGGGGGIGGGVLGGVGGVGGGTGTSAGTGGPSMFSVDENDIATPNVMSPTVGKAAGIGMSIAAGAIFGPVAGLLATVFGKDLVSAFNDKANLSAADYNMSREKSNFRTSEIVAQNQDAAEAAATESARQAAQESFRSSEIAAQNQAERAAEQTAQESFRSSEIAAQNQAAADAQAQAATEANNVAAGQAAAAEAAAAAADAAAAASQSVADQNTGGDGGGYGGYGGDSAGSSSFGEGQYAKGGFVSKKNKPVATKSKKGLASRK